jgi:hypothetical protein
MGSDNVVTQVVVVPDVNTHVFIHVRNPEERPDISLDLTNLAGRQVMMVRVNGMVVASLLLDVKELPAKGGEVLTRYCPVCGEEINIGSSKMHQCDETRGMRVTPDRTNS